MIDLFRNDQFFSDNDELKCPEVARGAALSASALILFVIKYGYFGTNSKMHAQERSAALLPCAILS